MSVEDTDLADLGFYTFAAWLIVAVTGIVRAGRCSSNRWGHFQQDRIDHYNRERGRNSSYAQYDSRVGSEAPHTNRITTVTKALATAMGPLLGGIVTVVTL